MQHVKASAHSSSCFRRTTGLVTIRQVTPTTQFIIKAVHVTEKVIRRLKMMKAVLILVFGKFASVS